MSGEEAGVGGMDLHLMASLTTLMGCPSPLVVGLSSRWYFKSLDRLGLLIGSDATMLEGTAVVVEEDLEV